MLGAGKFLARGSAGCFYSPGFTCSSRADASKVLFRESDAQAEQDLSKRAFELDPKHVQSVVPSQLCQKKWAEVAREKGSSECADHFKPQPNSDVWVLQLEGTYLDVFEAFDQPLSVSNAQHIAKGYVNVLNGLQFLHSHLLIHNDIHETNVVVKPLKLAKHGSNPMKLIDFGQSMDLRNFSMSYEASVQKYSQLEQYFLNTQTRKRFTPLQAIQWQTFFHLPEISRMQVDEIPFQVQRLVRLYKMDWKPLQNEIKTLRTSSVWTSQNTLDRLLVDNVTAVWTQVKAQNVKPIIEGMVLHDIVSLWTLLDRVVTRMSKTFLKSNSQNKAFLQFLTTVEAVSRAMQSQILSPTVYVNDQVPQKQWASSLTNAFQKLQRKSPRK